jgi:hypothetical protein
LKHTSFRRAQECAGEPAGREGEYRALTQRVRGQVSLPVVRRFVTNVEARAVGTNVIKGVRPDQQLVKFVSDELLELMGKQNEPLNEAKSGPTVILMAGLQVRRSHRQHTQHSSLASFAHAPPRALQRRLTREAWALCRGWVRPRRAGSWRCFSRSRTRA